MRMVAGAGSLARPAGDARTIALSHHEIPPSPNPAAAKSGFALFPELQHD